MGNAARDVVVGIDDTGTSEAALTWAAAAADRRGCPLTIMHAAEYAMIPGPMGAPTYRPDRFERAAAEIVAEAADRARRTAPEVDVLERAAIVGVTQMLVDASRGAELLVVGTRGRGPATAAALGSIAYNVTAHALCPVAVVRGDASVVPGPERPVVVGVDGSDGATVALAYAADLAAEASARLIVVAGYEMPRPPRLGVGRYDVAWDEDLGSMDQALRDLAEAVARSSAELAARRHPDLVVEARAARGQAAQELCAAAESAGMIVVGSRGRGAFAGLLLGSVSHGVIHSASCPVTVVR